MRNKEEAKAVYIENIKHSWTFERMTPQEKERCIDLFACEYEGIVGSFKQRWRIYNAMYHCFLVGLGYDGFNWRETEEQPF